MKCKNKTILTKNENKRWKFFIMPIFDGIIMDGHPISSFNRGEYRHNIGCPSIMTPSKIGKTKNLIFYSLIVKKCVKICEIRWKSTKTRVYLKWSQRWMSQ